MQLRALHSQCYTNGAPCLCICVQLFFPNGYRQRGLFLPNYLNLLLELARAIFCPHKSVCNYMFGWSAHLTNGSVEYFQWLCNGRVMKFKFLYKFMQYLLSIL